MVITEMSSLHGRVAAHCPDIDCCEFAWTRHDAKPNFSKKLARDDFVFGVDGILSINLQLLRPFDFVSHLLDLNASNPRNSFNLADGTRPRQHPP